MLQSIREGSQGWITGIIVGLISITFIAIGTSTYMNTQSSDEVALVVEGKKIKKWEVEKLAKRIMISKQAQSLDWNQAKIQALKALKENISLKNAAIKQGFTVSDQQVLHFLKTIPDFQENGHFSAEKYKNIVAHLEYTDKEFRNEIKNAILIDQLKQAFKHTTFKTEPELKKVLSFENQKRNFDYLIIPHDIFKKDIKITDTQLKDYYKNNISAFLTPEKVQLEYLELKAPENLNNSSADNAALDQAFLKKADQLINLTYDHSDSLIPAADQLGLSIQKSPWIMKGAIQTTEVFSNPKVLAAAFNQEVLGAMNSEVIQIAPKHYIVFRLAAHQKPHPKPFNTVQSEIEGIVLGQIAEQKAKALGQQLVTLLKKNEDIKNNEVIKKYNLKWESLQGVSRMQAALPIKLLEEVFKLPKPANHKLIPQTFELASGYQAVVILHKVAEGEVVDLNPDQKKVLETELENYASYLEFELFAKKAITKVK